MRTFLVMIISVLCALQTYGDAQIMIKQKAKDLRDSGSTSQPSQQNQRSVQPSQQSQIQKLSPIQENLVQDLFNELQKIKSENETTKELLETIQKNLSSSINIATKPEPSDLEKLTTEMAYVWKKQNLKDDAAKQILRYIVMILNGTNLSTQSIEAMSYNIEKQFVSAGVNQEEAKKIRVILKDIFTKLRNQ